MTGPLPEPGSPVPEAIETPPRATLEEQRQAAEWVAAIEDEELRETVRRAAEASLARNAEGRRF